MKRIVFSSRKSSKIFVCCHFYSISRFFNSWKIFNKKKKRRIIPLDCEKSSRIEASLKKMFVFIRGKRERARMNGQVKIYSGARTCPGRSWKNNRITRRGKIRGRKKKGGKGRERERERGRLPFQGVRTIDHGKGLLFKRTFVRDAVGFAIFPLSLSLCLSLPSPFDLYHPSLFISPWTVSVSN